jgi:hypothetical protein
MAYRIGDLSRGPCCEINKLIVQVVGTNHPTSQRLAIYERSSNKRLDALTGQDQPETVSVFMCAQSTLHVWDWSGEPNHRMMLEVEAEDGPPLRLPLPEVGITVRQLDRQHNQIVPVLPFVPMPGINSTYDHGTPVLCRPGFIYVFIGNRLWRELEVRITDERTTYHDVDLNKYRNEEGHLQEVRVANGKALDDIWLPSNWNDQRVDVQLCFSEVQFGKARLKRLEQDAASRRQRCQRPDLRVAKQDTDRRFRDKPNGVHMLEAFSAFDAFDAANQSQFTAAHATWLNLCQHVFPLSIPAPQRAQQPGFEWMLDQPAHYLCDLSGGFLATAHQQARQHVRACEKGDAPYRPQHLETGAWAQCLEQIVEPTGEYSSGLWEAQPPADNVLFHASARHLYGVMLDDPHYRLRHLNTRIQEQQQLLETCAARAQQYAHHGSALLIQQLVLPHSIGGQQNPLHQEVAQLSEQGRLDISRFTATGERTQLWRSLEMSQGLLCDCLQQPLTEQSLADYMSQDGFNYAAALYFISQLFVTLALRPAAYDPLAVNGAITDAVTRLTLFSPDASAGQRWLDTVVNTLEHPMHRMLWPDIRQQDLNAPYQAPATPEVNQGDGHFRATELAKAEDDSVLPSEGQSNINSVFLAGLLESGSLNTTLTTAGKGTAGALIAAHENLQGAAKSAEQAMQGKPPGGVSPSAYMAPRRTSIAVQQRGLAQLRSMLPQTFGDLHFLSKAEAQHKDYYVFGLDDLADQASHSTQTYGVYRNQYGVMKSPAEQHGHARPQRSLPPDRTVLGMPKLHSTAQSVRRANLRINQAWQQELAVRGAAQGEATGAIEKAARQSEAARGHWAYKALDSVPFAGAVVALEMWNLRNELEAFEQTKREKNLFRTNAGVSGAILDLSLAMEAITVKLAGSRSVLGASRKTLFTISEASAKRVLGKLGNRLVKDYSARLLGQTGAGLLFSGLNLYDAWYSYRWSDDAYIGHLLLAAGGLIGAAGGLIVGAATFLGLTAAAWVCLAVVTSGAALIYLLSSSQLEDWLKKGPFGADPYHVAEHLRDPQSAFYYLINLLADIRISIDRNPEYKPDAKHDPYDAVPFAVRDANSRIRIQSNLAGFISRLDKPGIKAFCALERIESLYNSYSGQTHQTRTYAVTQPVCHRLWPDALELLVKMPFSYNAEPEVNLPAVHHRWRVRAQITVDDGKRTWVFPAPPPKDATPFGSTYAKPDFGDIGRLFWADETTHKSKGAQ